MLPLVESGGDLRRIDASVEFKHQCLLFLCTRRVLNYLLQKPFFPLLRHAACRLHLFDNQPPARRLRRSLTPTRTKCMWTDSQRARGSLEMAAEIWGSCRKTQEHQVRIAAFISLPTVKKKMSQIEHIASACYTHTQWEKDTAGIERVTSWLQVCPSISRKHNSK